MPFSYAIILFLNAGLTVLTASIYWFYINLWLDQAILLSSGMGSLLSGITLTILAIKLLRKKGGEEPKGYAALMMVAFCFTLQALCLGYCFWMKPF